MPPEEESEDLFELLQGVKKGKTDDEGEEEEEEEEDEEEEAPKRKGPGVYEGKISKTFFHYIYLFFFFN